MSVRSSVMLRVFYAIHQMATNSAREESQTNAVCSQKEDEEEYEEEAKNEEVEEAEDEVE